MSKITWTDKTNAETPTGATTEMPAADYNEIKTVVNANDDAATLNVEVATITIKADKKRTDSVPTTMSGVLTLTWDATGAVVGNGETKMIIGDGNDVIISGATIFPDNGDTFPTVAGIEYLFVFIWQGNYLQMDVNPEITAVAYVFANTHKMVIGGIGDGITIANPACYPSDGAGTDEPYSIEIWGTVGTLSGTKALFRYVDDNDNYILLDSAGVGTGEISTSKRDGTDNLIKRTDVLKFVSSTRHQIIITSTGEAYAGVKIYIGGVIETSYTDMGSGTYDGLRALVGALSIELPRLNLASVYDTMEIYRHFNAELNQTEVTELQGSGNPVALSSALQAKCVQENLLNNNPNADNIGVNGVNQGSVTYTTI